MKLLKLFPIVFLSFNACGNYGPKVDVCISDPANTGFDCHNAQTNVTHFIKFTDTENYVCLNPVDMKTLLVYYKQQCK